MQQLPQELIEKALAFTGKTIEDVSTSIYPFEYKEFQIEKFYYYLLSPEFVDMYARYQFARSAYKFDSGVYGYEFAIALYEHRSGNVTPLITLLSKI